MYYLDQTEKRILVLLNASLKLNIQLMYDDAPSLVSLHRKNLLKGVVLKKSLKTILKYTSLLIACYQ